MAEEFITTFAYAKINLGLAVLGLRPDGYHELQSVMQTIDLHDIVKVRKAGKEIICHCGHLSGPGNLAHKAAVLYCNTLGIGHGFTIEIEKNIPVQAGLAGGSSDAAATLLAINELMHKPLSLKELGDLAAKIGSDVVFCLAGGTKWVTGKGETLQDLPLTPVMHLVIVKPDRGVNTGEAYRLFDNYGQPGRLDYWAWEKALLSQREQEVIKLLKNDLEQASIKLVPEIGKLKQLLLELDCYASLMSGSGSAVFGIARNEEHAHRVCGIIASKNYKAWVAKTR